MNQCFHLNQNKKNLYYSWKCIWKCRLRNNGRFVQGRWVEGVGNIGVLSRQQASISQMFLWGHNWNLEILTIVFIYLSNQFTILHISPELSCKLVVFWSFWVRDACILSNLYHRLVNHFWNGFQWLASKSITLTTNPDSICPIWLITAIMHTNEWFEFHHDIPTHFWGGHIPWTPEWYAPLSENSYMITSSNGNIFRVTGLLCGEFTGHRWIPRTKASDEELWCFLWSAPEQTVEQIIETRVNWYAIALIMTSLWCYLRKCIWKYFMEMSAILFGP